MLYQCLKFPIVSSGINKRQLELIWQLNPVVHIYESQLSHQLPLLIQVKLQFSFDMTQRMSPFHRVQILACKHRNKLRLSEERWISAVSQPKPKTVIEQQTKSFYENDLRRLWLGIIVDYT